MADKKFNLQFEATLEIGKMKTALDQINKSLTQTSVNLPKGISSTLNKTIQSIRTEMMKLEGLDGIELSPQAAKDVSKTYNSLLKNFQNLKVIMGDIGREFNIDPQRFFPKELSENIDNATKALNKYNNALNKGPQTEEYKALVEDLKKANRALEEYNDKASKAETKGKIATTRKDELQKELNIQKAISEEAEQAVKSAQDQIDAAQAQARTLKQIETLERKIAEAENRRAKAQAKSDQKADQMSSKKRTDTKVYAELESSKTKADAEVAAETTLIERYRQEIQAATESAQKIQIAEEQKTQALERAANARKEVKKAERSISSQEETIKQAAAEFTTYSLEAQKAEASVTELAEKQKKANDAFQTSALKVLVNELNQLGIKVPEVSQNLPSIQKIINNLSSEPIQQIAQALKKAGVNAEELEIDLSQVGNKSQEFVELSEAQKRSADEMQRLKSQILDFFSVTNAIQLFKRTVQSALNTVKELDAVMTETAVVTDFTVGDMWEKLPQYSKEASALGASIRDLYSATTLYYQQGLQTDAAMGVGIETMKMARIANMEAADATTAMTAALRGFNMEVNELNAQRVNDVYSELAAITAADTSQIATAMSKTASIAASANMEFETTSALLAQIIETTQEAPETAGTAMKTIIARFTEVKELFSEGMLTGEDTEGEEININKIDAALKTVGISLKDFLNGSKGIDDIFLELASKWDDLDLATQRYIATTAAGSRQQSRFIAMMSNYERTMELVSAANNSAGASQEQFDKTLESMEAKLQKLKNAWDQFAMGLANNEILKGAVDILTGLLNVVNKLTESLSGGNGLAKSIINLMTVIGALKGGGALLNKLDQSSGLKNFIKTLKDLPHVAATSGKQAGESIRDNLKSGFEGAITDARQAGVQIGQQLEQGIQEGRQLNPASLNVNPSIVNNPNAQSYTIEEVKEGADKKPQEVQPAPISEEAINKTNALGTALKNTSTVAHRTTGILFTLAGAGATYGASAIKAKDETNALAAGLEGAGAAASIGGSALSMLAPILSTAGVAIGPVIGIIAGLTAVIGLLSWAIKDAYNKSIEGRLEAAAKSTENARIAAEEAKAAYDELLQNKAGYNELQTTLNELTRGTNEWKQALVEANQQVLQLLETYPELVQFMSREGGQLVLEDAGWSYLENLFVKQAQNTQRLYSASQMSELSLEKELQNENLLNSAKDSLNVNSALRDQAIYSGNEVLSEPVERIFEEYQKTPEIFAKQAELSFGQFVENFKQADAEGQAQLIEQWNNSQFASKYGKISGAIYSEEASAAAGPGYFYGTRTNGDYAQINFDKEFDENINIYNDGLSALAEETGFTTHELYSMREGLATYDSYLQIYGQKLQVYAENLLSYLDEPYQNSQYSQQVTTGLAKNFASRSATEIEEKKNNLLAEDENGNKINIQNLAKQLNESGNYKIVDTTGSDKTYQEIYEQLTGASAEGLSVDVLANEISKIMVSEELSDSAQELIGRLDKLATKDEGAANQAAALISQDVGGLNLGEISSLKEVDLQEIATQLEYDNIGQLAEGQEYKDKKIVELDEIDQLAAAQEYYNQQKDNLGFENVDEALNYMQENEVVVTAGLQLQIDTKQFQNDLEAQREDITKGIDSIFEDGYTEKNLSGISVQNLKSLTNQIAGMGKENGKEYITQFQEIIAKSNLGEEQADQLATYLSNVDWSDMNEAVAAMDYMRDMGLDPSQIKNFWNVAVNGANAYMSSLEEVLALTEALQGKMKNVGEIEKALTEGTGTYDQMMELVNAGVDISNFQLTPEGWKATAEQIEFATDKLKQYNAEQARMIADQQAKAYENALSNTEDSITRNEDGSFNVGTYGLGTGGLTTVDGSGKLVAGTVDMSNAEKVAAAIDAAGYNSEVETYDQFIARIQEAYNSYISLLNNGEDLQIIADKQAAMAEAANYTAAENEANGGSEESIIYSAQNEATEAGLDSNEMMEYAAQLQNVHTQLDNVTAAQVALANSKMNMGLGEIISSYKEWTGLIDESTGLIKASASEDVAAFNKLKDSVNKMLNTSEDLSDAFWENANNMKLIKKAAEGDTEALGELQKIAAKDYLVQIATEVDDVNARNAILTLADFISTYELPTLEAGVQLDDADFIARCNELIVASNMTSTQVSNAFKDMGYDVEFDSNPQPVTQTHVVPVTSYSIQYDEKGNMTGMTPSVTMEPYEYTSMVAAPTIKTLTSTGSGGGGISTSNQNAGKANIPSGGGGGGGGGGGSEPEKWENPYDEFYNTIQKLNEELRKRNKLEREYQKLLDKVNTSADDLTENSKKQLESLEAEKKTREGLLENRKKQMKDIESENSKYSEYAWYNEELGVIEIDWEKINELDGSTDEEFTQGLEDFISQLEDQEKLIEEEEDALDDIYEETKKIRERGKDEYFDFENQIKEALIDSRQKEIDKLSAINESINDTNARLLDAMQSSIDKYRQDRENERTEEDLSDKQRRLAYLQQDTSGANDLEILQLQKEIEEGQEDYTDTLIDQKISELQEQNDKAAGQRERQIQIMEEQLKHYEESGEIWNDVYALIGDGVDATGKLIQGSELVELLKNSDNFEGLSNLGQVEWLAKLEDEVAEGFKWLRVGNSAKALLDSGELKKGQKITFTTKDRKTVTGTLNEDGSVTTSDGKTYKDVYKNYDGNFTTTENYQEPDPPKPTEPTNPTNPETPELTTEIKKGVSAAIWNGGYGWGYDPDRAKRLKEVFGENDIQRNYVNKNVTSGYSGKLSDYSYENMKKKFKVKAGKAGTTSNIAAFKTGGLADFTGPAWLDGTKSRPEYILNAEQTKSFFQLVDVLGSLKSGASQSSQITGDSIYDVDINVESIGSDYDVEQLASTIKRMINDDARYRNNNAINLQR